MDTLQQIERLMPNMTRIEKVQLLDWIVRDLSGVFLGIEKTPGICGGDARIVGTRIPVWILVQYRKLGASDADLLQYYPTLQAKDLTNAWAYYRTYQSEIDEQITENEMA